MLKYCVETSIRLKWVMLVLLIALLAAGGFALKTLPIDAVPDVSTVQVAVLTDAPGLSPVEVERGLTFPLETARHRAGLDESRPQLIRWLDRIHSRPAYHAALARGGPYAYA